MFKKSVLSPFATWKNFLRPPTTVRYPKQDIDTLKEDTRQSHL